MQDYIKRIRRLGANDAVNGEVINSVVQELEHNIDLLYGAQNSLRQDKSLASLLYGNLLDYDQTGYKRFINGGQMDAIEKVIVFDSGVGTIALDEADLYDGKSFLTWSIPQGITNNIVLRRNIKVPEALLGQKILVGFKVIGYSSGIIQTGERFDIYVNNTYSGSGDSGLVNKDGIEVFKTVYGVYDLGAEETNIEISLVRSVVNTATPSSYLIRLQSVLACFHVLSNTHYELNFPTQIGPLNGVVPDINYFYDFENISVNPIPSFIFSTYINSASGTYSPYTINITSQETVGLDEFFVGPVSTGDGTGKDSGNRIDLASFLDINHKHNHITVTFSASDSYTDLIFDDGSSYELIFEGDTTIAELVVANGTYVSISTDYELKTTDVTISDSKVNFTNNGSIQNKLTLENLTVSNGDLYAETTIFSMPIASEGMVIVNQGSNVDIIIDNSIHTNASAQYGFGFSTGPIEVADHSNFSVTNNNVNLMGHIGFGDGVAKSIEVQNHSSFTYLGTGQLSTSSDDKTIKATKHSSVEIENMQMDGVTAFDDYDLSIFSSLSTTGINDITGTTVQSYVYEFQ